MLTSLTLPKLMTCIVHRPALWKTLFHWYLRQGDLHHQAPVQRFRDSSYIYMCGLSLTEAFAIKTGVKQGCLLSPLLFSWCIDCMADEGNHGKQKEEN